MTSLTIWRALCKPPQRHPLFMRFSSEATRGRLRDRGTAAKLLVAVLVAIAIPVLPVVLLMFLAALLSLPVMTPIVITMFGTLWAARIGGAISRERERNAYDLLCVLPQGQTITNWVIGTASIHRDSRFQSLYTVVHAVAVVALVAIGAIALIVSANLDPARGNQFTGAALPDNFVIEGVCMIALLYVDYMQTIVLALTVGMSAANGAKNRLEGEFISAGVFLTIQVAVYVAAMFGGFIALPALFNAIGFSGLPAHLSLYAIRFLLLIGGREVMIHILWRGMGGWIGSSHTDYIRGTAA